MRISRIFSLFSAIAPPAPRTDEPGRVLTAVERLESDTRLDPLLPPIRRRVRRIPRGGRDLLHGRQLGHPFHPIAVQVPIGAWLSAAALDLMPGEHRAADALVGVGLAGAAPAAISGWADWAELHKPHMRVGLVHAVLNVTAVALYGGSLAARIGGRRRLGRTLSFTGLTLVGVSGSLGGHLAYRQAAGANHAEQVPYIVEPGWHELGSMSQFPVGEPVRRTVGEVPVVVVAENPQTAHVLADRCSHLAGPLSQGKVADGCVECPWHGSTFRLSDGYNVKGPATAPQPVFQTRVVSGMLEARFTPHGAQARTSGTGGTGDGQAAEE
ncbi:hypothetical protein GCM10009716_11630 [Streptomyces sodiiphilus]|uniref:Rieske domain-containing protein n=1 Tax=Streptomyces sodiiphilus TaxID=226217 RepID=A0ABP5A7G8_9ACTN